MKKWTKRIFILTMVLKEKQELLLVSRKKDAQEKSNERDIT